MKIITLKRFKKEGKTIDYVLIPARKQETDYTTLNKNLPASIKDKIEESNYKLDNIVNAIYSGKLENCSNKSQLVYHFKQRQVDIKDRKDPYYRDYNKTPEKQKEIMAFVNVAPDYRTSFNTAITACGSKYGIILSIKV